MWWPEGWPDIFGVVGRLTNQLISDSEIQNSNLKRLTFPYSSSILNQTESETVLEVLQLPQQCCRPKFVYKVCNTEQLLIANQPNTQILGLQTLDFQKTFEHTKLKLETRKTTYDTTSLGSNG